MIDRAVFMSDSSQMETDPLSDVLRLANAHCVLSGRLIAGGSWEHQFDRSDAVKFLAVLDGSAWLAAEGSLVVPLRIAEGDVIITNAAPALIMASTPDGLSGASTAPLTQDEQGNFRAGSGSDFVLIGGLLKIDPRRSALLLGSLPPLIHVGSQQGEAEKLRWLLIQLSEETVYKRAGAELAANHLAKLMFVEALRLHIANEKSPKSGWLAALEDPRISAALRSIHSNASHAWTLGKLATASGMSRTSFAVLFRTIIGVPPLTYLTNWRMSLAERELIETSRSIAEIAWSLGYSSESSFSNAFSRTRGLSPGRFRKAEQQTVPTLPRIAEAAE